MTDAFPNRPRVRVYTGPLSFDALEAQWRAGELPLDVADALDLGAAAGLVLSLPTIRGVRDGMPVGFGLLPPLGAAPVVRVRRAVRDLFGEPIPARARGVLGAMWREPSRPERPVLRLWFRSEVGHGHRPEHTPTSTRGAFRIADCHDDLIASVLGLEGQVPQLTGWQIARLDDATPSPDQAA